MIGSHNKTNDITDSQGFSMQSYYDAVLEAIAVSDIYQGTYKDHEEAPIGGAMQCGMAQRVDMCLSCNNPMFIDLNESDIHYTIRYHYKLDAPKQYFGGPAETDKKYYTFYIGPKRSFDLIERYRLQSNDHTEFITCDYPEYESFIEYIATINDGTADETTATIEKIRNMSYYVPGFYHVMDATHDNTRIYEREFSGRIPITNWTCLKDVRWFQFWMGELRLVLYPNVTHFCIVPVWSKKDLDYIFDPTTITQTGAAQGERNDYVDTDCYIRSIAAGFNQTDTDIQIPEAGSADGINKLTKAHLYSQSTSLITHIQLITRQAMLKPDVAAALQQQFIRQPIMFPILNWSFMKLAGSIGKSQTANPTAVCSLQHCDTGFLLFRRSENDYTCMINPEITFRLDVSGYTVPNNPYNTYDDWRFSTLFYDGFNIKGNENFKLQKSVYNSLQPYITTYKATANQTADGTAYATTAAIKYNTGDRSNFCIPIPFTADEWFQGGMTKSNATIKLIMSDRRTQNAGQNGEARYKDSFIQPVFVYAQDHVLRIYSVKPAVGGQIDISNRSVERIIADGMI